MLDRQPVDSRARSAHPVVRLSARMLGRTLQPFSSVAAAAANIGVDLAPSAAARVLESPQVELLVSTTLSSERIHAAFAKLLESDAATQLIDQFFDSGLFERFIARLLESQALWDLVDTIADSPTVTAAITQQSLGFADQMGEEVRGRSRKADDWLERAARRLIRRHPELSQAVEGPDPAPS